MQQQTTVYNVFIAAPNDASDSRMAVRDAILQWNSSHGKSRKVMLSPIGWDTNATPEMGSPAQQIVNHQLLGDADILIATFQNRLGTPTASARSGTVEEIELSMAAGRRVSIYFSAAPVNIRAIDLAEVGRLQDYENECKATGLLAYYSSTDDLKTKLQRDLAQHVDELQGDLAGEGAVSPAVPKQDAEKTGLTRTESPGEIKGESAWDLLSKGDYEAGMKLAHEEAAADPAIPADEWIAFYRYHAFSEGRVPQALTDLRESVAADPSNTRGRFWYARALRHDGSLDLAEAELRTALKDSTSPINRSSHAKQLSIVLAELGRVEEARLFLKSEISNCDDPSVKSGLLVRLADLYRKDEEAEEHELEKFLLLELAVDLRPNDSSLRFDLAHSYSDQSANQMALVHYEELLKRDPRNSAAANNAGVSAGTADLPLTSIERYRRAEELGESLGTANLVSKLIGAGFIAEAEDLIGKARAAKRVHPNLDKAAGDIVSRQEREEEQLKELTALVTATRKFRVRQAKALLAALDPLELSGPYEGSPSSLLLTVRADKTLSGSFDVGGKPATLSGTVEGGLLKFEWRTVPDDKEKSRDSGLLGSLYLKINQQEGHGMLLVEEGSLNGYWTTQKESLDPPDSTKVRMWKLRKASSKSPSTAS